MNRDIRHTGGVRADAGRAGELRLRSHFSLCVGPVVVQISATPMELHVKRLTPTAKMPVRATENASCFDVHADMEGTIAPGARLLVKTGLAVAVPPGFEVQVRSRSGLALKHGVAVLNSPGTVDADYRGEVGVILINHGAETFAFKHGERIAQIGVYRVEMCPAVEVAELEATARGAGGFGHTGR